MTDTLAITTPGPTPGKALIYLASTRWGHGTTTCFCCEQRFTYEFGATIYAVTAPDLCDRPCGANGTHRWDCAALGGDLCESCVMGLEAFGPANFKMRFEGAAEMHQRAAEVLTAFASADWGFREGVRPGTPYPGQRIDGVLDTEGATN